MGDFNARFSIEDHPHIGDLAREEPYNPPAIFSSLWKDFGLWVPSTFSACHGGASYTWYPPGGGKPSRIDYIAVPLEAGVTEGGSFLFTSVDLGQKSLDHVAVGLDVFLSVNESASRTKKSSFTYDRDAMRQLDNASVLQEICLSAPDVGWEVDVHTHYELLASHFRSRLQSAFPQRRRGRNNGFLSDHTWTIRSRRICLRKQAQLHRYRSAHFDVLVSFKAWYWGRTLDSAIPICAFLLSAQEVRTGSIVQALRDTHKSLRASIRKDKAALIHSAAVLAAEGGVKNVMQRLRPLLGPPKRLCRDRAPLPGVKLADGSVAPTSDANLDRWVEHFSAIEGGFRLPREQLAAMCVARQMSRSAEHFELGPGDLPSLSRVEAVARNTAVSKAMGVDCIPGELAHCAPAELSRAVYPLLLKIWLRNAEPLHFKGGTQHSVWKRKGPQDQCDGFRAILVTSVIGKLNHALLRQSCIDAMAASGSALQIGGLPKFPVIFGSLVVRLFQASASQECYGLIFLDLREAFYRVVRPLLVNGLDELSHVQAIVDRLQLPTWAAADIVALWKRPATSRTSLTLHQQALWRENFSDAWFQLPGQHDLVRTSTGSRPGDSLADAGLYFLFTWVLKSVTTTLRHEGWLQPVPWDERMLDNLHSVDSPAHLCWPLDVTWMDDLCLLLRFNSPHLCATGTSFAAGILVDTCLRHGMEPNLGPGKTECIVQYRGKGARELRRAAHSLSPPSLPLMSQLWKQARIRIVPRYKHLGGLVFHSGGLLDESRSRVGQAWSAFNRHYKSVCANPGVCLSDKCQIYTSIVESSLLNFTVWSRNLA